MESWTGRRWQIHSWWTAHCYICQDALGFKCLDELLSACIRLGFSLTNTVSSRSCGQFWNDMEDRKSIDKPNVEYLEGYETEAQSQPCFEELTAEETKALEKRCKTSCHQVYIPSNCCGSGPESRLSSNLFSISLVHLQHPGPLKHCQCKTRRITERPQAHRHSVPDCCCYHGM